MWEELCVGGVCERGCMWEGPCVGVAVCGRGWGWEGCVGRAVCGKSCLWEGLSEGGAVCGRSCLWEELLRVRSQRGAVGRREGLCVGRTFEGPCLNSVCL